MRYKIGKERTHLFSPSIHVAVAATIHGGPSDEELIRAITYACHRNEILSSRIVIDSSGDSYYESMEPIEPSIRVIDPCEEQEWITIIKEQERIPFAINEGELVRFFLLKEKTKLKLLVIGHHLAGDGLSFSYLMEDIMNSLTQREKVTYKPMQFYTSDMMPEKSKLSKVMRILVRHVNSTWKKRGKVFDFVDYQRIYTKYWENRTTELVVRTISGENYISLKAKSKRMGVTLNSLLVTALIKAIDEKSEVGMAVSLRPEEFRGMANCASAISIKYYYNDKKSFLENGKEVQERIYKKLHNDRKKYFLLQFLGELEPTLIDSAYFAAYAGYENKTAKQAQTMFGYGGNSKGITVTNLAKLNIKSDYGKHSISEFVFIPPLVPNAKRLFGIVTLEDCMNLVMHVNTQEVDQNIAYFDKAIAELMKL